MANFKKEYNKDLSRSDIRWYHPEVEGVPGIELYMNPSAGGELNVSYEEMKKIAKMTEEQMSANAPQENLPQEVLDGFTDYEVEITGCVEEKDAPLVKVIVLTPQMKKKKNRPAILFIAGGGLSICAPRIAHIHEYAYSSNAVLVAPRYRTTWDSKYPGAINDVHATYEWMYNNAEELGIDPDKIVIVGQSSGAHLAGALAFRLKRHGYHPRGVVIFDVVLEDRQFYPSQKVSDVMWTGLDNFRSSMEYLGGDTGNPYLGPEAYPNRANVEDCKGLCPFFIHTNEIDPESDPAMHFSSKLRCAGVYTELHQWGGVTHGMLTQMGGTALGDRFRNILLDNIKDCLKYDLRRLWNNE